VLELKLKKKENYGMIQKKMVLPSTENHKKERWQEI
jgi:hypothetical protein